MVRGGLLSPNKGAPTMEGAFTERNDGVDYPRNFDEAYKNVSAITDMIDNGDLREDILATIEWAKPINHQKEFDNIIPSQQVAESTYLSTKTILEFNIEVPRGNYVRLADFELVIPVRFRDEDGNRINLGEWIPVNNFWGRFLEGLKIERKQDLKSIVIPRPPRSLASHARSIMQHMANEQLKVIEREMLFIKEPVVGENIHYRLDRQGDHFFVFNHLNKRREKFAQPIVNPPPLTEGQLPVELEYIEGHQIHRDNLLWKNKKYVIPMKLLHNFFAVSSEISTDMLITFNIEQEVKKLFEAVFTREIGDDVQRGRRDKGPPRLQIIFYETPKINYNLYTYSPQKQSIEHMVISQINEKGPVLNPYITKEM